MQGNRRSQSNLWTAILWKATTQRLRIRSARSLSTRGRNSPLRSLIPRGRYECFILFYCFIFQILCSASHVKWDNMLTERVIGRIQHSELQALYWNTWLHAGVLCGVRAVLRDDPGYSRQNSKSLGKPPNCLLLRETVLANNPPRARNGFLW
jgi:hypothetical protein